ncbi:ribosome small subunit-dependent GTPase A [Occallatibacter savannae]|uniref:ribosome small subunit-dependent GTPase A n=1 Tax=Occallatibacter savannae TaxID=1002691 RepID=UPI000D68F4FE|nr:ribosome small subunit-dependent GTPase A [Occallatibacter savannae]
MQLHNLGWNGFFAIQQCPGTPARVASASRDRFTVWTETGELEAVVSGDLRRNSSLWPAVGDWVGLRPNTCVIDRVFERKTTLSRKQPGKPIEEQVLAANIDTLFIVTGLDRDFNERRIERYLVLAQQSGARPVIVLNKADLAPSLNLDVDQILHRLFACTGDPVLPISAATGLGLEQLSDLMALGETAALIGSSGVGKSTLVNRLLGLALQPTGAVRADDQRGRHTTTTRSMFAMPSGWLLIDMPGLREVQLWAGPDQLDSAFHDIEQLAQSCRFRDCTHSGEPGCALAASDLDPARLENYRKLQRELDYLDRKLDKRLMSETKARWKVIHKAMRHHPKTQR